MKKEIVFAEKNKLDEAHHVTNDIRDILSKYRPYGEMSAIVDNVIDPSIYLDSSIVRFGIAIDKTDSNPDTRVSYIHDAVGMTPAKMNYETGKFNYGTWKDVWFMRKNKPIMLKYNGTEAYELDPNDYSKKADGTSSDISNTSFGGNAMSRIPLVYVSMTEDNKYEYISVSNVKYDETYKAIAHTKEDGRIMENLYISIFRAYKNGSKLKSTSGMYPATSLTVDKEIAMAKENGDGWFTRTWGQRMLINALLMIISKSDNSQEVFGNGVSDTYNPEDIHKGMVQSGTLNDKGQFFGYNDNTHAVKVFHIENWWGNQWERIAGLVCDHGKIKYTFTGPYNTTGKDYNDANIKYTDNIEGVVYQSKSSTSKAGRFPIEFNGSSDTYICDGFWLNVDGINYALVGGLYSDTTFNGASYINLDVSPDLYSTDIGVGISYL